jgi:excisionase family DNA binding protein
MSNRPPTVKNGRAPRGPANFASGSPEPRPVTKLRTVNDVAELFDSSTLTVRRLIASGALPVHRVRRSVRISDADIAAFLAANRNG